MLRLGLGLVMRWIVPRPSDRDRHLEHAIALVGEGFVGFLDSVEREAVQTTLIGRDTAHPTRRDASRLQFVRCQTSFDQGQCNLAGIP